MAEIKRPQKVLVLTGLLYKKEFPVNKVLAIMTKELGDISLRSDIIPFKHTEYYKREMGKDLFRQWFIFDKLVVPDTLVELKHRSNKIEQSFLSDSNGRQVNIDPGFITMSNLILASTKNYSHRIYIGKGIYAEVTLIYKNNNFTPLEWTYPDYQEPKAVDFFQKARGILKERLKNQKNNNHRSKDV